MCPQCNGISSGAFHIKGNVVMDLAKNLDTECVAGVKMATQLSGDVTAPSPSAPASAAPSPAPSVPATESLRTPPPRSSRQSPGSSPRSPPGFPARPQYSVSPGDSIPGPQSSIPVLRISSDGRAMSPRTANIRALSAAFRDVDLQTDFNKETYLLEEADSDGDLVEEDDGNMLCNFTNGLVYQYGHGREKCSRNKCFDWNNYDVKEKPNNCGYHERWRFPDNFAPCGDNCQGAFCRCLPKYNYYNHNLGNRDVKKGKKKK